MGQVGSGADGGGYGGGGDGDHEGILDIYRGRRRHCPWWRIFLSCGEILDVETF